MVRSRDRGLTWSRGEATVRTGQVIDRDTGELFRFSKLSWPMRHDEENGNPGRLLPTLREAEVDLYLCGHLHVYERTRFENLTQVMAGANRLAYGTRAEIGPTSYLQVYDERQCYVSFTLRGDQIQATAISLAGDPIDAWTQPLNCI